MLELDVLYEAKFELPLVIRTIEFDDRHVTKIARDRGLVQLITYRLDVPVTATCCQHPHTSSALFEIPATPIRGQIPSRQSVEIGRLRVPESFFSDG